MAATVDQYNILHADIFDVKLPAIKTVQDHIITNRRRIQELRNKIMTGLVQNSDGQTIGTKQWPPYAIAFVVMNVMFLLLVIVIAVRAVRILGVSSKSIAGAFCAALLVISVYLLLLIRYT